MQQPVMGHGARFDLPLVKVTAVDKSQYLGFQNFFYVQEIVAKSHNICQGLGVSRHHNFRQTINQLKKRQT